MFEPHETILYNKNIDKYYSIELNLSGTGKQRILIGDAGGEMVYIYREHLDDVITYLQYTKKYWEEADAG